jgi:hypothetical protein
VEFVLAQAVLLGVGLAVRTVFQVPVDLGADWDGSLDVAAHQLLLLVKMQVNYMKLAAAVNTLDDRD